MRWLLLLSLAAAISVTAVFAFSQPSAPPAAEGVICNPWTTAPQADMLPIGTRVTFNGKPGTIEAYYIQAEYTANCHTEPLAAIEARAYVISYGDPLGTRIVLNRNRFEPQG